MYSRKFLSLLALPLLALGLISCTSVNSGRKSLNAGRPREEAFRPELKKELSSLTIAIGASASELGETLNRLVARELYKGSTKTKGLTADILRNGPIVVSAADNYLYLTLPISMSLSYGSFETPAIATKLKFRMNPRVTPDWRIDAEVIYTGLSDSLSEEVGLGPFSIKPRSIVEGITQPMQRTLSELIGKKLNEKIPLKAQVAKVWAAAQKPILLDKTYKAWLKITPQEVLLYPLFAQNNQVQLSLGLRSFAELVLGPEPPVRTPVPLPNLKRVSGTDRSFRVALHTDLFYKDVLEVISPMLLDKDLGRDGKSAVLKELDLYGNGERLMIKLKTTGSLDGTFYLTCRPVFDPQTNLFSVEEVDFDMQSESLLLQSADWFLHGSIRDSIRQKLNLDLTARLAQAREMAGKAMARVNLADHVFLTGSIKAMKLNGVMVQKDKISIQVYTEGETAVLFH